MRRAAALLLLVAGAARGNVIVVGAEAGERCAESSAHKNARWLLHGRVELQAAMGALGVATCTLYAVPAELAHVLVDIGAATSTEEVQRAIDKQVTSRPARLSVRRVTAAKGAPPPQAIAAEAIERGVQCKERHCDVDRALFERVIATGALATSMRIVPWIVEGKVQGMKMYAIRPGGLPARLGFQNGDTVVSVDGTPLNNPEDALAAYARVQKAGAAKLVVDRRGATIELDYTLK